MTTEIKKLYLKTADIMAATGLTKHRVELIARKHMSVPKYINGHFKFTEDHIEKIKVIDLQLKQQQKSPKKKSRVNKKDVARIKRDMAFLGKYVTDKLNALAADLAVATGRDASLD